MHRRTFLKLGSGAVAGACLLGPGVRARAGSTPPKPTGEERVIPTFCDVCFWRCNALATTRGGRLWKIEGNPQDPLSRGRLCPRGTGGVGAHYDPDRLRRPLLRKGERGAETWHEVSWDEALGFVAERMQAIRAAHGPEAMALFSHGIGGTFLKHLFRAWGSPNIAAPSFAQCRGPRDVGFHLTFGEEVGSPERTDIEHARCLVLLGCHLGENMHNTQVQEFAEAVGRGTTLIVADPRFSVAASKAKYYLPIRPGTDLALLLAWMHVLIEEGAWDRAYVDAHGYGFDAFAASLAPYTPEWAWTETGIAPDVIRETAGEMGHHRPATLVHPGRHVTWYGDDAQRSRAVALLNAMLGSWGRKGGFYQPASMDVPAWPYPPYPPHRGKADNPDQRYPFALETLTTGLREATLTGKPYPLKGWFVYATNPLYALPNVDETIAAVRALDLLVVIDVVPSEIAGWADVVLPEAVYLERYDELNVELFRQPFVALRQPVVDPPDDQKSNAWIARELGLKLGLGAWFPWRDVEEYLRWRVEAAGLSWETLTSRGLILGPRTPLTYEEGVAPEFDTPSGKIEFWSNQLQEKGFDPVPRYTPPDPVPPGFFRLLYGRAPVHSFSRTQTNPLLHDIMPENAVWVHSEVAHRLGLRSGDRVRLRNQDGVESGPVAVKATCRIRPDCVYLVHGFGHTARGLRRALGRGINDALLLSRYRTDPLMGGTGLGMNFVTILPVEA
ncbi:MAG: molybdopterin-dependent oxidoreductase [Deltaproteobacteria bacterium]|nr:molybdopterin-dependent oxidoreductase [Deltaproteobacteria bacterium]